MNRPIVQLNLPPSPVPSLDRSDRSPSTAVQPVDRQGEWNALPGRALGRAGISRKAAAVDMACDPSLLSARLAGHKHLPWSQLGTLGAAFATELVMLVIDFYDVQLGMTEQERRDCALGRALREAVNGR